MTSRLNELEDIVINKGTDLDMTKITGCKEATILSDCENCERYYSCFSVSIANGILAEYKDLCMKEYKDICRSLHKRGKWI